MLTDLFCGVKCTFSKGRKLNGALPQSTTISNDRNYLYSVHIFGFILQFLFVIPQNICKTKI